MASHTRRMLLELDDRWTDEKIEGSTSVRRFKDSIHDYLPFGPTICAIIDTPQFQRLRNIKQLGTSYYVWPGASHNRFEHCLGVAYLAQTLAIHLKESQPSLGITQRDVQCVTIAGLCHDLGHGPWSHVWDSMFIPSILPEKKWCHEDASRLMFDALLEENELYLAPEDAAFVKALIMGDMSMTMKPEKPYLFQIVANKKNGLDVDKFDYIARDSHAIDQKSNLSLTRLIYSSRVIDDEICYDIKDALQIFELCHTRMSLHKRIYTHKTAKAIEYMIVDALTKAEPVMHIARRLEDPKEYLYLTDYIQIEIEASKDPRLAEAQAILHRVRVRDLYSSVDFKVFPWHCKSKLKEVFTPESVVNGFKRLYQQSKQRDASAELKELFKDVGEDDATALGPEHVIIDLTAMHHGMQDSNPLDFVKFYSKHNPNKGIPANPDDVSVTLPSAFGEVKLRVYTRESRFFGLVQLGYREVLRNFQIPSPPRSRELTEPLEEDETGALDLPLELEPEPVDPLTPPAETPSASSSFGPLGSKRGRAGGPFGRAVSMGMGALGTRPRAPVGRSKSAMVDRAGAAVVRAVDNQFTTVAPTFKPRSPTRTTKGVKRGREEEGAGGEAEGSGVVRAETAATVVVSGGGGGTDGEKGREGELDLDLDHDFEGGGKDLEDRGRKRSKLGV
ncbi:HD-domain/PDEase-like protein [Trametes coccinea BRFM310]|uniref:HD-domain/PDEase-like protein n=1 Tax=Trametes coccinea (strain BRFM310) TaxID=1353009 RepID=A0A1Y2IMV8_TRAC3|nr:HD-domain/PDEase-like protein [Trametes coccinea BRFM310]